MGSGSKEDLQGTEEAVSAASINSGSERESSGIPEDYPPAPTGDEESDAEREEEEEEDSDQEDDEDYKKGTCPCDY